ncbi:MAG TPA: serine/threonine-protein kinase [Pyrinomonadaceae bacterium]|nr:serine/threonine-protein kinase [Pyrinomonadaceae bacterium]
MKTCPTCGKQFDDANTLCPSDGTVLKRPKREDPLVGQVLAGKYRIEEKIDEGGMGCVYRATHVLMEKTVAVKVLHPALAADEKIVARFTREARAASRISHPHAINVTDFGESEGGVVYLVMEYLRGGTLKDVIRSEGPMPLKRVVEIVRQMGGALEAAHAEGVVHRDLKSDNIMLQEAADGSDWAKVLDFGIAKIQESVDNTDPGLTAPNIIIGTPQYMSPEQCAQASDIDARSDIYSFGVILYEMFVGHVPFTGDSPTVIMMKHLQDTPPSVLDERKDLPAEVGRVVARALAKRPEDRFQKVSELSEALALAAEGESAASLAAAAAAIETDRIVQPTGPNEAPRTTVAEELDESTVVTPRYRTSTTGESELPPPVAPMPEPSFNPWRIALPAIALLAVVFAVFFAFQRDGGVDSADTPPLQADPNSQPVQSVTPPTGQAERNLVPTTATPQPGTTVPSEVVGGAPATTQPANANAQPTPAPDGEGKKPEGNQNTQPADDAEEDEEEDDAPPVPTPTPRPRRPPSINTNQRVEPPPAAPTPKKVDEVKPEKPPADQPQVAEPPSRL